MYLHIFILHYEQDELTHGCIDALYADPDVANSPNTHIFVIDNGSPKKFVKAANHSWVKVIRLPQNKFLIDAFNAGIQQRPAPRYLCITNDTKPSVGMVGKLMAELDSPNVGIVAPGTNDTGAGVLHVGAPGDYPSVEANHVDNVCWGWRHDLVEAIGLPDCEGHTHRACWASNQDYCYRAWVAGFKVLAVRGAYIEHAHMGGGDQEAFLAGRDWLLRKWGELAQKVWA